MGRARPSAALSFFMAYRCPANACRLCDEAAFSRCAACECARCVEHTVAQGPRCTDCEHAFHTQLQAVSAWPWRVLGVLVAAPLFPLITGPLQAGWRNRMWAWGALPTGLALFDAVLITTIVGLAVGHALWRLRLQVEERRFDGNCPAARGVATG